MNRIVLIGNGFDLANGYKTSYKDFIEWLLEEKFNSIFKSQFNYQDEDLFYQRYDPNITTYSQFRPRFYIKDEQFVHVSYNDEISSNNSIKYKNRLLQILINNHFIIGWADIENIYYDHLINLLKNDKSTNENIQKFQDEFQRVINLLQDYLFQLNKPTPDIGMRFKFKKVLNQPIVENEISIEYKTKVQKVDYEIKNGLILDFNYTDTTDNFYDEKYSLIHIHGKLNSKENPIIFGFGDELDDNYSNIEKSKFKNNVMRFIKSVNYLKNDNYRKLLNFINSEKYQISIVGHSCSNTDRTLLNTLFEHENCVSIKPFFRKYDDGTTNYFELVSNISRNFKDKKMLRDRVVNESYCTSL